MRARLAPGRDENASAGGLRAAGLEADDPVLAQQRVVVADHAGHRNDGRGLTRDRGQRGHSHRRQAGYTGADNYDIDLGRRSTGTYRFRHR